MGIYYKLACDDAREIISPSHIDNLGQKFGSITQPNHPLGAIFIFAMATIWNNKSARVVNDSFEDSAYSEYEDVTEYIINEYNKFKGTEYVYTGLDDEEDIDV